MRRMALFISTEAIGPASSGIEWKPLRPMQVSRKREEALMFCIA